MSHTVMQSLDRNDLPVTTPPTTCSRPPHSGPFSRGWSSAIRCLPGRILAIGLAVAAGAGCTSMGTTEPLEVTLANLRITEITVFETTLVAELRITNPNPEAFTIDGGSFKLILDDTKVGSGTASETFTVERLDSAVIDAIFHLNNASALLRLQSVLQKTEVTYGIRGSLFTKGSFGTKKIKIEKTGRLDLSKVNSTGTERPENSGLQPTG